MYFGLFPYTYYTLDDRQSVQVITNILVRAIINQNLKNNYSAIDEYDVQEGETPEIVSDKIYGSPLYHWVILHLNDIVDPRFGWLLSDYNLRKYCEAKYQDINAVHHYEDINGNKINGNVYLNSTNAFINFSTDNVILSNTNIGTGVIVSKISNSNVVVKITDGGFITGDQIKLSSNSNVVANISSTSIIEGIPITNINYEEQQNEQKRRIKILRPQYLQAVVKEFEDKIKS